VFLDSKPVRIANKVYAWVSKQYLRGDVKGSISGSGCDNKDNINKIGHIQDVD